MSHLQSPDAFIAELWSYAEEVPMEQHPWFHGLLQHRWRPEQIILGVVAAQVYQELTGYYGFSERAAETYHVHGEQDVEHGARQIAVIRACATDADTQEKVRRAVKLGLTAYTLEWDGHVQAMTGRREFWSGTGTLSLRAPTVRLARVRTT